MKNEIRPNNPQKYVAAIAASGLSIYDKIDVGHPTLWIPTPELEVLLHDNLVGTNLAFPLRTRSKIVKEHICKALGYPVPKSFTKTQPRFPGQIFDTYVQKSNNLQVWNEDLSATRRYVIIRVNENDVVNQVKAVTGDTLPLLDTTGTLTQKYQARCVVGSVPSELVTESDTQLLAPFVSADYKPSDQISPVSSPAEGQIISIRSIYDRLSPLIGIRFQDAGIDQERNRGAALHRLVCERLGYAGYQDDGRFPDVRHQLLEVKLQTAPTIDLGLVTPSSEDPMDMPQIDSNTLRHCDVRYAIFYAKTDGNQVETTHLFVTSGEGFFDRFPQFQGKVLNKKLQIPLPTDFFEE